MKKLFSITALLISNVAVASVGLGSPELTTTQPGLGAGANTAKYPGKGLVGALTVGHYNMRGIDVDGDNQKAPDYTSLEVILPHLSYYTDYKLLGGYYSFGITGVYGGIHQGNHSIGEGISNSPWLHPIRLNWELNDDFNIVAGYSLRLGVKNSSRIVDKGYDMHTLNIGATYDINQNWQINGAFQYEHRTSVSNNGYKWQAGDIGYIEGSVVRKFDNGMTLGAYAYHIGHLNRDSGIQSTGDNQMIMGRFYSQVSAAGLEFTTPIEAIDSALAIRVHEEFAPHNHSYGTRAFITLSHKF